MKLKRRTVTRIRIGQQHSVRQVLAEHVRISDRDHIVEDPIHDEAWLTYLGELGKAVPGVMFPGPKSCDLSLCNVWARYGLTILFTFCEPRYKSLACRLTRFAWREEEFHQLLQSWEIRIVSDPLQLWL